jgi:hypothetical protein
MLPERYEYKRGDSFKQYEFYSDGPKGRMRKVIFYSYLGRQDGYAYYNLGFGDYDPRTRHISDLTVSDNKDRDKILATVAATALDFTARKVRCRILVKGSTPARTRLYQMKIVAYFDAISELFDIQCQTEKGTWKAFKRGEKSFRFLFERRNFGYASDSKKEE